MKTDYDKIQGDIIAYAVVEGCSYHKNKIDWKHRNLYNV